MLGCASLGYGGPTCFIVANKQQQPTRNNNIMAKGQNTVGVMMGWRGKHGTGNTSKRVNGVVRCSGIGMGDFIGGDLVRFDLGKWLSDVEEHKALAIYSPHEGGYEGRYLSRLRRQGYYFLDLSARGLGDPETTLTKIHPVCPVSFFVTLKFEDSSYSCSFWLKISWMLVEWCYISFAVQYLS